jgi:hypothetical protein
LVHQDLAGARKHANRNDTDLCTRRLIHPRSNVGVDRRTRRQVRREGNDRADALVRPRRTTC